MDDRFPGFSFIVPAYNAAAHIEACIGSVLRACTPADEIIVVDDGSTDDTVGILKRIAELHSNFHILPQKNGGAAAARFKGLEYATKDYVVFLDADDELMADTLQASRRLLGPTPVDVLCCDFLYWDGCDKTRVSESLSHPKLTVIQDADAVLAASLKDAKIYFWTHILGRLFLQNLSERLPRPRGFEDIAGIPLILKNCASFLYLPEPLVKYRQHSGSLTKTYRARSCMQLSASIDFVRPLVEQSGADSELSRQYNIFCLKLIYWVLEDWVRAPDRREVAHGSLTEHIRSCMTMPASDVFRLMEAGYLNRVARRVARYWARPNGYVFSRWIYHRLKALARGV